MCNKRIVALLGLMAIGASASAATITIEAGAGFSDSTVVAPVGGNSGTTLGAQRTIVFQQAANQWAALLNSSVAIRVQASMSALTCTATSGTLGSAGPNVIAANFPNAPRANTIYVIAEANALAGSDLDPGTGGHDDIHAQFNVTLDAGGAGCLGGEKWWYGIDPNVAPAANTIPLLPVVFHELGHGLGFVSNVDSAGNFPGGLAGDTPIWADYLFDTNIGKFWKDMTVPERLTSTTNDPFLVWTGPRTNRQARDYLKQSAALLINGITALPTPVEVGVAQFGPAVPGGGVTGNLVYVNDGVVGVGSPPGTIHDGCETFTGVSGKIALIDRGFCSFETKVLNAQTAGATAVIIANNVVDDLRLPLVLAPDGSGATITIPSYSVTQAFGLLLAATPPNVTLGYANIGLRDGCVRMFAPNPALTGSSVSHFHADAFPNLLMEPALNTSIFNKVDLTLPFFADMDWSTNIEDFIFVDGFEKPCLHTQ